jgi:DNA-binding MarR family transcriptional regulator
MAKLLSDEVIAVWARLHRTQRLLLEQTEADLKQHGLPPLSWYDVLLEVYNGPGHKLRQYEISEKTLLTKYNLSRLLDRLEIQGLIGREVCDEDRRGSTISITNQGKTLLKNMWAIYGKSIQQRFADKLTTKEIGALDAILKKLIT